MRPAAQSRMPNATARERPTRSSCNRSHHRFWKPKLTLKCVAGSSLLRVWRALARQKATSEIAKPFSDGELRPALATDSGTSVSRPVNSGFLWAPVASRQRLAFFGDQPDVTR